MKTRRNLMIVGFLFAQNVLAGSFPPLQISLDDEITSPCSVVNVSVRAGNNWQNITTIKGTIVFDHQVIAQPTMVFWGLTNPVGVTFQNPNAGILTYNWDSLIAIGPTLNTGDVVFTLQFKVNSGIGSTSIINFTNIPELLYWENGFGWDGNNFEITNGSVSVEQDEGLIFCNGFDN